jgi:hypothetical protein
VQPKRIVTHWMTYFPGTTALDHARERGILDDADVERVLNGDIGPGYMFGGNKEYRDHDELKHLSGMFDLLPLLPRQVFEWLLEERRYRHLRGVGVMRQFGALAPAIRSLDTDGRHHRGGLHRRAALGQPEACQAVIDYFKRECAGALRRPRRHDPKRCERSRNSMSCCG